MVAGGLTGQIMLPALAGLWTPVSTPFTATGGVDAGRLVAHGRQLLADGSAGLAILGTTSEANSLSVDERRAVMDACAAGGIPAAKLLPGTGSPSLSDAVALTRHAAALGCAGVLLLPPYYYKAINDDGLFAFVASLIEKAGANVPGILLYHIPPIAVVGWSIDLVGRLIEAFPGVVVGMKNSSGDLEHVKDMIASFPGFAVFPGSESHLLAAMTAGAVGCISATANINAAGISKLIATWRDADAGVQQAEINAVRAAVEKRALIPAIKAILAARYGDEGWRQVRPPLLPLADKARTELLADPAIVRLLDASLAKEAS